MKSELEQLREWKSAILDKCKASDGFNSLEWGGDKEGWGFVHYFIGHLETRALHAETILAEQDGRGAQRALPQTPTNLRQSMLDAAKDQARSAAPAQRVPNTDAPTIEFGVGWAKIHFRREVTDQDRAILIAAFTSTDDQPIEKTEGGAS